ncbi:MAG: signal recognition particle-docking protein FtsY [Clostridiales bacterium]|nr:signal recognition particle-docking protein FtsY [Clostridiales bacterium]
MGLFGKFKKALNKTKESFLSKLDDLFKRSLGDDFFDELEELLISSDVSVKTSMEIVENLRDKVKEERLKDKDYVIEIFKEELTNMLLEASEIEIDTPAIIMLVGVNGVGKTTTIGKLANKFIKEGKSVTIAAADTFRAAAADQLSVWADRAKVRIIKHQEGGDPSAVVFDAIASAKAKETDILIIDTAGRLHVKANLMEELKKMDRIIKREYPEANLYKLMVLDATTGQNAFTQVEAFDKDIGIDGLVLTKLDGSAKGGFIISLSRELNAPVCFVGTGEKIDDIEDFDAEEFIEGLF